MPSQVRVTHLAPGHKGGHDVNDAFDELRSKSMGIRYEYPYFVVFRDQAVYLKKWPTGCQQ